MAYFRTGVLLLTLVSAAGAANNTEGFAQYGRALALYNHTDYRGAISLLKNAPENPRSLELLGRSYLMDAEYRAATETLERAVALSPNDSMTMLWLGRVYGRRAETSFAVSAMGWANKTRQAFEKSLELDPSNADAQDDLFEFYLEAPGLVGGGLDKARALVPAIAKRDRAEAASARARIAEKAKDFQTAEAEWRCALNIAPHQVGRVLDLAAFLAKQGRLEESDQAFERAAHMAPDAPKVLYRRAATYIRGHRNGELARELLGKYLASANLTPDDPSREEAQRLLKKSEGL